MSVASATSSLAGVATRIQERNNALRMELATLELLRSQHDYAKQCLKADQQTSIELRKQLLTTVRSRNGLELECLRIKEESSKIDQSTSELKTNIDEIRKRTKKLQKKFDEEHAPVYAAHDLSIRLYSMQSESRLIRAQRKKQRREEKLRKLIEQTKCQREKANEIHAERERIRVECLEMDRREEEEDEETVALNMQIKSLLAKVRKTYCLDWVSLHLPNF